MLSGKLNSHIEKELEKIEALPKNEGRKALIKKLKQELVRVNA